MSKPYATEALNELQREIEAKDPADVLQFCANFFNAKLELQRALLWRQKAKAEAAGLTLFPDVKVVTNLGVGGVSSANGRQPSFKSPFGVNDPHLTHEGDPVGPGSAGSQGLFKGSFEPQGESLHNADKGLDTQGASSPGAGEPSGAAKGDSHNIPVAFNANRRTSVSAEALNPDRFKQDSWKPPKNNLSEAQKNELAKTLSSNFLFNQLDNQSKRTVVDALVKKSFKQGDEIIHQGDAGDYFYIIEKGIVDFYINGKHNSSSGEGSSFGELALMYNSPRAATAKAASDEVICWALDRLTFRRILLEGTFNRRLMYEAFLKDVKVLSGLSNQERLKLADALTTKIYEKGDKIVKEGEKGENFFFIEKGSCHVIKEGKGVVKKLGKGDYFGEVALLNDLPRQATVEALDTVIVATLGKSGFTRLLGPAVEVLKSQDPTHQTAQLAN